jgi:RNase adaptor protein for sRNA GlmZ degradation
MSVLHIINVSRCAVPPPHICRTMNRLNPECLRAVFRSPRLRELYQDGLRRLEDAVRRGGGGFAVGGTCGSGTHRSVSVVERMAGWLRNRGFEVQVRHLDIRTPRLQMER